MDSENGTFPKLLEMAQSDTDGHSVPSTVRETTSLKHCELTACKGKRNDFNRIDVLDVREVDG